MNKEYTYLSNEEILVSDEFGHTQIRKIDSTNMHDVLQLEKALEYVTKVINKFEGNMQDESVCKFTLSEKIFAYTMPFWASVIMCAIVSFMTSTPFFDLSNIEILIIGGAATIVFDATTVLFNNSVKKPEKLATYALLNSAYNHKKAIEQRLAKIKSQTKNNQVNINNNYSYKPQEVISLEDNPIYKETVAALSNAYEQGYNSSTKKRILKK